MPSPIIATDPAFDSSPIAVALSSGRSSARTSAIPACAASARAGVRALSPVSIVMPMP
jgi:hypothetical protein